MFSFTDEIWRTFRETAHERAKYLKTLYMEQAANFNPIVYLDVGAGLGYNTFLWGENASEVLAVDLSFPKNNLLKDCKKISLVIADVRFLPLKDGLFDMVSLFSVIEHVTDQELALKEVFRVSKSNAELIIQVPNRLFPLELHSGLPFIFYIPSKLRAPFLERINYGWLNKVDTPNINKLRNMTCKLFPEAKIAIKKVMYPPSVVWSKLRPLYIIFQKFHILHLIPLGYLLVIKKRAHRALMSLKG